ncbi:MAG TPA: C1 family peptidase [Stenomitos sp.]
MFKQVRATVALALAATALTACGVNPNASMLSTSARLDAAGKATTRYALGARLTERKVIDDEKGYRSQATLPQVADLRAQCSPVANQGGIGACTGFAIASGLDEFLAKKAGRATTLSPAFVYYQERKLQGNADMTEDSGSSIETGMKVLEQFGTCPEADMPFLPLSQHKDPAKIKTFLGTAPSATAVQDALGFKIAGSKSFINNSSSGKLTPVAVSTMSAIRRSLADGMPVVAGMIVFQSMMGDDVKQTGLVPMPTQSDKPVGGHAVMIVGYDQAKQVFIVRNSWSASWGDKGYFYLPYDYVRVGLVRDAFTAVLQ